MLIRTLLYTPIPFISALNYIFLQFFAIFEAQGSKEIRWYFLRQDSGISYLIVSIQKHMHLPANIIVGQKNWNI